MEVKNVLLETVCGVTSTLPRNSLPEIVFAGKSNVGKSSLINVLLNRKALARVSAEPGKTRTINFYRVNDGCYFVDLPGYSFANVPKSVRLQWGKMIENYLNQSRQIRRVFLLVDLRREPSENDLMMADWIRASGRRPAVIATKLDKVRKSQVPAQIAAVRRGLLLEDADPLIPFSAATRQGREEILSLIAEDIARR
ncbi:MAG: ribosome biogenesis GTP-binding protein YihA/YsxC [Lachnospiraceae bacterium]